MRGIVEERAMKEMDKRAVKVEEQGGRMKKGVFSALFCAGNLASGCYPADATPAGSKEAREVCSFRSLVR